jgi:hypothetical protein
MPVLLSGEDPWLYGSPAYHSIHLSFVLFAFTALLSDPHL